MVKKARVIVSILVIVIIGFLVIPIESDNSETVTTVYETDVVQSDDINMDQTIINQAIQEYSVIETNRVFTESDNSLVSDFLDDQNIDSPLSSEKFGVETQVALFDSNNDVYNFSDVFGIAQLSVTDSEGRLLDLGSIQATFESISKQKEITTDVWGKVEFYLDDDKVGSKYLWGSDSNSDRTTLSIVDNLVIVNDKAKPPLFSEQEKKNFTFTLSDEGRDWEDNSEHTYRIVITELHADLNSDNDIKKFSWKGQHIAYELKVTVDEKKKVVLDEKGNPISIFKDDSTIQVCGMSAEWRTPYGYGQKPPYATENPRVTVKVPMTNNELSVPTKTIIDFKFDSKVKKFQCSAKHCFGSFQVTESCSDKVSGIPRNTPVIVSLDYENDSRDIDYEFVTPLSQTNYYISEKLIKSSYPVEAQNSGNIIGRAYSVSTESLADTNMIDNNDN